MPRIVWNISAQYVLLGYGDHAFSKAVDWKTRVPYQMGYLKKFDCEMECFGNWPVVPRDPGSPSENGFMEPKYLAF